MINKVYFIHISIRPRHSTLGLMSRYSPCPDLLLYPVSSGKYFNLSGIQPEIFQYILHPTGNIRICPVSDQIYGQISGLWQNILAYISGIRILLSIQPTLYTIPGLAQRQVILRPDIWQIFISGSYK